MITNLERLTEYQRERTNEKMAWADAIYWSDTVAYPISVRPIGVKMWFDYTRNTNQQGVLFPSYEEALAFFDRRHKGSGLKELRSVFEKCKEILPKHQQPEFLMMI